VALVFAFTQRLREPVEEPRDGRAHKSCTTIIAPNAFVAAQPQRGDNDASLPREQPFYLRPRQKVAGGIALLFSRAGAFGRIVLFVPMFARSLSLELRSVRAASY